jgi:hypothetical protein
MKHRRSGVQPDGMSVAAWVWILACVGLTGSDPAPAQTGQSYIPQPITESTTIGVGNRDYLVLGEDPVVVPLIGPGTLWGFARVGFAPGERGTRSATLVFQGISERTMRIPLDFRPPGGDTAWGEERPDRPSGGRRFEIYIPEGVWNVRLSGRQTEPGFLTAIVYYDGPGQPRTTTHRGRTAKVNPWRYRNQFGLEVIYDNNILTMSPDYIDDFVHGRRPDRYQIDKYDDLIIAPSLDFAADRRFLEWGNTRLRFRVKRWMYTQNPINTNTDFDWYVRQFFRGGKSLELNYHFSPEQYIRQLSDRTPFSDTTLPVVQKPFRFTRNVATIQWRHRINAKFDYSLLINHKRRYYNKPFIENDIIAWEFRGQVGYRVHRRLRLTFDYSFEPAQGRAMDTVGQTPETSTASDPTHVRDLYRLGFFWTTRWARPVFDSVDGSLLHMDYHFTTDRPLFDDPYHTGRRDQLTRISLRVNRRLTSTVQVFATFRYSEREVESPWPGDITIDKDYTQQRYGVGMTRQF